MRPFSVLMAVYGKEIPEYLEESIESIWTRQTCKPSQIVLVKDGALTKELDEVVARWSHSLGDVLKVVPLEHNRGLGRALNAGLKHCTNELVARMDADDRALPARFETQLATLAEHPDVDVLGSCATDIDVSGNAIGVRKVPSSHEDIYPMLWTCPVIHPSVMFRKSVIVDAGSYSEKLKRRQDYELWFRVAAKGARFHNVSDCLMEYRVTDDTYKRNNLSVAYNQAMIGLKGCAMLNLGLTARVGVFYPVLKSVLPLVLRRGLESMAARLDPRKAG